MKSYEKIIFLLNFSYLFIHLVGVDCFVLIFMNPLLFLSLTYGLIY